jgi:hypothetical protein
MVPKKDESWRPCGNYRRLNLITTSDKYPLPNMQDLSSVLEPALPADHQPSEVGQRGCLGGGGQGRCGHGVPGLHGR